MSTTNNVQHTNSMLAELKSQQAQRITQLETQVAQLQEEIRLMKEFHDRLDDL